MAALPHLQMSWTLTMLYNCLSTATRFNWQSFSYFIVSSAELPRASISLFTSSNHLSTLVSESISPVVFACLQPLMSCQWNELACTPTPCGMRGNITCHNRVIGVLSVHFLLLTQPVSDMQYPKYTFSLHWVREI